jgi:hypothetical protein
MIVSGDVIGTQAGINAEQASPTVIPVSQPQ